MTAPALIAAGLVLGLAHALHCAAMCGVFALAATRRHRGWGLAAHALGRSFTYAFLGALAGAAGGRLADTAPAWGRALGVAAAVLLVAAGVRMFRTPRAPGPAATALARAWARVVAPLRAGAVPGGAAGLGVVNGLLPCGVVAVALAQAAALATPARGALLMIGVGAGTVPALAGVVVLGGPLARRLPPRRLAALGGLVLVAGGLFAGTRALAPADDHAMCPLCAETETTGS